MATSSIRIKKICQWCGAEFEAQKVSTKYCSHRCANLAYKQATREKRVKQVEAETHFIKSEKPKENVKDKEYLSIAQTSVLLGLSLQAVYKMIYAGHLVAYKLSSSGKALCACPPKPSAVDPRGPKFTDPLSTI